jgi:hypothetical protein
MAGMRLVAVMLVLAVGSSGCIAYRALTTDDIRFDISEGETERLERRARAMKRRGGWSLGIGLVEVGLAGVIAYALATGVEPGGEGGEPQGQPGVLGEAASELGDYVAGLVLLALLGGGLAISGLGDVGCGIADLAGGSCDQAIADFYPPDEETLRLAPPDPAPATLVGGTATIQGVRWDEARAVEAPRPPPGPACLVRNQTGDNLMVRALPGGIDVVGDGEDRSVPAGAFEASRRDGSSVRGHCPGDALLIVRDVAGVLTLERE